jgi:hypothetical protein
MDAPRVSNNVSSRDIELALRGAVDNLQLMYKYGDRINPIQPTVHQLLVNINRISPYFEAFIKVAKEEGWYYKRPEYFLPIEDAIKEGKTNGD